MNHIKSIKAKNIKAERKSVKRVVTLAIMVSQALVLSIIESFIPVPVPVPGVKLGLANIISLMVIIYLGWKDALLVVLARCALSSIYSGGYVVFLFSVTGGILSVLVMALLHRTLSRVFSVVGISIAGAIIHNMGQFIVASILMMDTALIGYIPVLLLSGVVTGCFVGLCASFLAKALERANIFKI